MHNAEPGQTAQTPERVLFPLWAKMGLVFGSLVGLCVAAVGWFLYQQDLQHLTLEHRRHLLGLAQGVAAGIDGDLHQTIRRVADMERPEYQQLSRWLREMADANQVYWIGTLIPQPPTGLAYALDPETDSPLPPGYPLWDIHPEELEALRGTPRFLADLQDEWGSWDSAFAPIRNRRGEVVGLVEVDSDRNARVLREQQRLRTFLISLGMAVLAAVGAAVFFAGLLNRHLARLSQAAWALGAGNLDITVDVPTRDELGLLGQTFNRMISGLREREFIRETFGRFVDRKVVEQVLTQPGGLQLGGELRIVTVLISDLRGFTGLTEQRGPEQTVALLNRYFSRMVEVVQQFSGNLNEYTGDGMVILFGAPHRLPDDALRAVACAVAMQQELARFNAAEGHQLEMGIGLHTGEVIAGNVGSQQRMKYTVVGSPINLASRLEASTVGNQVLLSEATAQAAGPAVELEPWLELQAKGRRQPLRCAAVRRVGAPFELAMPELLQPDPARLTPALRVEWRRVVNKQIDPEVHVAIAQRVSREELRVQADQAPEPLSELKLRLWLPDGTVLEELYVRVVKVERAEPASGPACHELTLRFTSIPAGERQRLGELITDETISPATSPV